MIDGHDKDIAVFILSLLGLKGVGPKTVTALLDAERERLDTAVKLDADFMASLGAGGASRPVRAIVSALDKSSATWEELEAAAFETLELASDSGVGVLHPYIGAYPKRLLRNESHPPILYVKGNLDAVDSEKAVAIIGTRNPTEFGYKMGRRLAQRLAEDGYVVVSGLAIGCDTAGHEGALDVGGKTVAIIPTPIDAPVYPKQNQDLAERIVGAGGALVSEYAPGIELSERQLVSNLVARDEWQPALSDGVIAVETSIDGGTRHAIEHALKTGTPVAVFDYSTRKNADFFGDPRFGGNVKYLRSERGVSPIFELQTVEDFKARMDAYRQSGDAEGDLTLFD